MVYNDPVALLITSDVQRQYYDSTAISCDAQQLHINFLCCTTPVFGCTSDVPLLYIYRNRCTPRKIEVQQQRESCTTDVPLLYQCRDWGVQLVVPPEVQHRVMLWCNSGTSVVPWLHRRKHHRCTSVVPKHGLCCTTGGTPGSTTQILLWCNSGTSVVPWLHHRQHHRCTTVVAKWGLSCTTGGSPGSTTTDSAVVQELHICSATAAPQMYLWWCHSGAATAPPVVVLRWWHRSVADVYLAVAMQHPWIYDG